MRPLAGLFVVIALWSGDHGAALADMPDLGVAQTLPLKPLTVQTGKGDVLLRVQVADTDAARQTGLMYRRSMPETEGMLFIFEQVRPVAFWMKNTPLALDLIFIGQDGVVNFVGRG